MKKEHVEDFYNQEAKNWNQMYDGKYEYYPANQFRLEIIVSRLKNNRVKKILDIGCGACAPMIRLLQENFECVGCDFAKEMVEEGAKALENAGFDPKLVSQGDIEDESSLPEGKFDAILALGVFPHVKDAKRALKNMKNKLNGKGKVFISFRNDLFSVFTLNNYSKDFFLKQVIDVDSLSPTVLKEIDEFYSDTCKADNSIIKKENKISYTEIKADFDNPLTIENILFNPCGFNVNNLHFYHYHALPPIFEQKHKDEFRKLSMNLEKPNDWRGYIMASAFVVEATKNE
ncbi:MAG: methyltransferase domain-containing protein [Thaumarchaeota archaeon]|nr:methyltransferase domain-containing protein [Nitrososphaerota archaeon]